MAEASHGLVKRSGRDGEKQMKPRLRWVTGLLMSREESEGKGEFWLTHLGRWGCYLLRLGNLGKKEFICVCGD